ncbi:hypothetical protein GX48_05928 [Paracoccidioides brasiliensis]|nr:hypothetical protein GX48_05928 [Paracoccidioides brasiliensis]
MGVPINQWNLFSNFLWTFGQCDGRVSQQTTLERDVACRHPESIATAEHMSGSSAVGQIFNLDPLALGPARCNVEAPSFPLCSVLEVVRSDHEPPACTSSKVLNRGHSTPSFPRCTRCRAFNSRQGERVRVLKLPRVFARRHLLIRGWFGSK